jgi:hypothetical protein
MEKSKRITANLPAELLEEAQEISQQGITETIILGLQMVRRTRAYEKAAKLKGRLKIDLESLDLEASRERSRY